MKRLKVAVIGTGSMGFNHVRLYRDMDEVELVAVSDVSKDNLKKVEKFCENQYIDYKKMIENEDIDIISIVVPTSLHKKVALDVMKKGIHILLEKPIASSIEASNEIIECAKNNNVKLMIGHIERFNPAIIELKKKIQEGALGKVFKIDVNRVNPFPSRISDVGVVIDLAVHDIDIARFILESEVKRVYAETEKNIHTNHEDLLSGLMKFENNTICNLNINWLTPTKIRKLYITGEKGMFVVDYMQQSLYFYKNAHKTNNDFDRVTGISEGEMVRYAIQKKEPLRVELEEFIKCVSEDKDVPVSGEDGLITLDIARKIIESANQRSIIKCK